MADTTWGRSLFQVRVDQEVRDRFEALHRRAQGQVPDRVLSRADVFDILVSSGSAAFDAGALLIAPPVKPASAGDG